MDSIPATGTTDALRKMRDTRRQ